MTLCISLVPSPTPSFSSLLSTVLSSDEKLGVGLGTRLIVYNIFASAVTVGRRWEAARTQSLVWWYYTGHIPVLFL